MTTGLFAPAAASGRCPVRRRQRSPEDRTGAAKRAKNPPFSDLGRGTLSAQPSIGGLEMATENPSALWSLTTAAARAQAQPWLQELAKEGIRKTCQHMAAA